MEKNLMRPGLSPQQDRSVQMHDTWTSESQSTHIPISDSFQSKSRQFPIDSDSQSDFRLPKKEEIDRSVASSMYIRDKQLP
jgi:hypothetical protein